MTDNPENSRVETDGLAAGHARRTVLGGLVAGALAAVGLEQAEAKKKGRSKGKGKGHGKSKGKGNGKGKGKGQTKVSICHRSGDAFGLIHVGSPATKAHEKHGDIICEAAGSCQTGDPIGCDQTTGDCLFAQATDGTVCTTEAGDAGTCTEGICGV